MLVVAKGTLIDWSKIYSVADDEDGGEGNVGGGGVIIEYFTTDSESQPGTYNVPGGFQ